MNDKDYEGAINYGDERASFNDKKSLLVRFLRWVFRAEHIERKRRAEVNKAKREQRNRMFSRIQKRNRR